MTAPKKTIKQVPEDASSNFYQRLGFAAASMMRSSVYCQYPVACLELWIKPAILHNQIHFFLDRTGNLAGYVTWAFLAEDTEERLLHDPEVLFHISEWNEGDRLWIMDFVVLDGPVRPLARQVYTLFPNLRIAKSLRRGEDGAIRKVTTWRRRE